MNIQDIIREIFTKGYEGSFESMEDVVKEYSLKLKLVEEPIKDQEDPFDKFKKFYGDIPVHERGASEMVSKSIFKKAREALEVKQKEQTLKTLKKAEQKEPISDIIERINQKIKDQRIKERLKQAEDRFAGRGGY